MPDEPAVIEIPTPEILIGTFAEAEQALATALPGYQVRVGQQKLAEAIETLFADEAEAKKAALNAGPDDPDYVPTILLGAAPCGIGKSFAHLIPVILSGRRTLVSVTTKSLQAQLVGKDIPFLETHLPVPFTWAELRGRSNYLCLNSADAAKDPDALQSLRQIRAYAADNPAWSGLREDLPFEVPDLEWAQIHADAETCHDVGCGNDEGLDIPCYATRARRRAATVQIVVINHALLATEVKLSEIGIPSMLDSADQLVCDEAHELADSAAGVIGFQFRPRTFSSLANSVHDFAGTVADNGEDIFPSCSQVIDAAEDLFARLPDLPSEVSRNKFAALSTRKTGTQVRLISKLLRGELQDELLGLLGAISSLLADWEGLQWPRLQTKEWRRRNRLESQIRNARTRLHKLISDDQTETVRWVEKTKSRRDEDLYIINAAPVSVADFLHTYLWSRVPAVLVSATLVVNQRFDYVKEELGIDKARTLAVDSPFDFQQQGHLYVPRDLPLPAGADMAAFDAGATEEIVDLIKASRGRALVLFTSRERMRNVAAQIRRRDRLRPYELKVQGEDSPGALAGWFKDNTSSVLFGLKSFMTGFDAPGEALSLLIVDKLPFPVPSEPITEAKCDRIKQKGGNWFGDWYVPTMGLVLQQALGRLIRHTEDVGVAVILDRRIVEKPYGAKLLRDLPPFPLTRDFGTIERFFSEH